MKRIQKTFALILLLLSCITAQELDVPEFNKTSNSVIDPNFVYVYANAKSNSFLYAYCWINFPPIRKCTIKMETPTSYNTSISKVCNVKYPVDDLNSNPPNKELVKIWELNSTRVMLRMPSVNDLFEVDVIYSFINMDTCNFVHRHIPNLYHFFPLYTRSYESHIIHQDNVEFILYNSTLCGNLHNCLYSIDFDGNNTKIDSSPSYLLPHGPETYGVKTILKKTSNNDTFGIHWFPFFSFYQITYFNKNQDKKKLLSSLKNERIAVDFIKYIAINEDFLGICQQSKDDADVTKIFCFQYDDEGNLKFNATVERERNNLLLFTGNIPQGGMFVLTVNIKNDLIIGNEMNVTKIDKNGHLEKNVAVKIPVYSGLNANECYKKVTFKDHGFCMFTFCAIQGYKGDDGKYVHNVSFQKKCVPLK